MLVKALKVRRELLSQVNLDALKSRKPLEVRQEMSSSNREEAKALAESRAAVEEGIRRGRMESSRGGRTVAQSFRVPQEAEEIKHRHEVVVEAKITRHGDHEDVDMVRNEVKAEEVGTLKKYKARCLREMSGKRSAEDRFETAMKELQTARRAELKHDFFADLEKLDSANGRRERIKNAASAMQLAGASEIDDEFERIFTTSREVAPEITKVPAVAWTIPPRPEQPTHTSAPSIPSTHKVEVPLWVEAPLPVAPARQRAVISQPFNSLPKAQTLTSRVPPSERNAPLPRRSNTTPFSLKNYSQKTEDLVSRMSRTVSLPDLEVDKSAYKSVEVCRISFHFYRLNFSSPNINFRLDIS